MRDCSGKTHTEERDALQIREGLHVLCAKNSTRIHNSD